MNKDKLASVRRTRVSFPAPDGTRQEAPLLVHQSLRCGPVALGQQMVPYGGRQQVFRLLVPLDQVRDGVHGPLPHHEVIDRFDLPDRIFSYCQGERTYLVAAILEIQELPCSHWQAHGLFAQLDGMSVSLGQLGRIAGRLLMERSHYAGTRAAADAGNLYLLDQLDVHPSIRGQQLGLSLMAEAVDRLVTSDDDLMLGQAMPVTGPFQRDADVDRSSAAIERLMSYYERAGFSPVSDVVVPEDVRGPAESFFWWPVAL